MEGATPLPVRSYFSTLVSELDIAMYQSGEWLNNSVHPLFMIKYYVKFLENISLPSAFITSKMEAENEADTESRL